MSAASLRAQRVSLHAPWLGPVVRRLVMIPVMMFVVVTLAFFLTELIPGDPATTIAGGFGDKAQLAQIRHDLNLDDPVLERYVAYVGSAAHGDLGTSLFTGRSVVSSLTSRIPASAELIVFSLIVAVILGLIVGTVGSYFAGRWPDRLSRGSVTLVQAIPDFLLALLAIYFLYYRLQIAPAPIGRAALGGSGGVDQVTGMALVDAVLSGRPQAMWDAVQALFLPVLTLGIVYSAYFAKTTRATMQRALQSQQVEFARACGIRERQVLRYAFLEARPPIITYGAILFGALFGGAAIVETVFAWQGVGQWGLDAIIKLDVPVIRGFIVAVGLLTILIYLVLDVVIAALDPRISL